MNLPFFSIIMLVYNTKEEYLRFAISSVLNQDLDNYEFIIIDDGSNIETKKILKEYESKCKIHHQSNIGMPASRIEGLKIATGDYIIFVDSDDYLNPKTLSIYKKIIDINRCDVVLHDFVKFSKNINDIISHVHYFCEGTVKKEEVLKQLCTLHTNGTCGRAVKKNLFYGMDELIDTSFAVGEDAQQSAYILSRANSFYYTKEKIYYYRIVLEHREYNSIRNINDSNYLTPVYKIVFHNNENNELLQTFKTSAEKSLIFNSFRMCLWIKNKKERNSYLNELNSLEIAKICNTIDGRTPIITNILYSLLNRKHYFLLSIFAKIYDLIYGMQKL